MVLCTKGPTSPEGRDSWTTLPDEYNIEMNKESIQFLIKVLDEIIKIGDSPHPNSRQVNIVFKNFFVNSFHGLFLFTCEIFILAKGSVCLVINLIEKSHETYLC